VRNDQALSVPDETGEVFLGAGGEGGRFGVVHVEQDEGRSGPGVGAESSTPASSQTRTSNLPLERRISLRGLGNVAPVVGGLHVVSGHQEHLDFGGWLGGPAGQG